MDIRWMPKRNVITMDGEIADGDTTGLTLAVHELGGSGSRPPDLDIYIASRGGDTAVMRGMAGVLESYTGKCYMTVLGMAYSAAAALIQYADYRYATPDSLIMLHESEYEVEGREKSVESWTTCLRALDEKIYGMILGRIREKRPKLSKAQFRRMIANDWVMDAEEAVSWGLLDEILETI